MHRVSCPQNPPYDRGSSRTFDNLLVFAHHYVTSQPASISTDLNMNDLHLNAEGL